MKLAHNRFRSFVTLLALPAMLATIAIMVAACGGSYSSGSQPPAKHTMPPGMQMSHSAATHGATKRVNIITQTNGLYAFSPAKITVKKGTKVTWDNKSAVAHTVTFSNHSSISLINPGQSLSLTFKKAGTFKYHCQMHPYMTGKVTVQR